jgi:hypothetical protein
MKDLTLQNVLKVMHKLHIDTSVISPEYFKKGMLVELEHGKVFKLTNVTHNDLLTTGKITLAHLLEMPDYYTRLAKMEVNGNKYWSKKTKPNILKTPPSTKN